MCSGTVWLPALLSEDIIIITGNTQAAANTKDGPTADGPQRVTAIMSVMEK